MKNKVSKQATFELIGAIRQRYTHSSKHEKKRILDEFVAMTGYHRKHAIRLMREESHCTSTQYPISKRIYDQAVKEALIITWEASDRICSKRLKAIIPTLVEAMERCGHLNLDPETRKRLLSVSSSTIDRLLAPVRKHARNQRKRRNKPKKASKQISVRTFADWDEPKPGELEIDFVVHCGGSMAGTFIHSLVTTDVFSGWTEAIPLLAREQSLVVGGLDIICNQYPFPVLGFNSDNDSAFINDTLLDYCERRQIKLTRSRPNRKNDQAWIEQKNGAVIRRFVGYERFSGIVAGQALAQLYQMIRLYVNYYQPSFKLREKTRDGSKIRKQYFKPATPCERLLKHEMVGNDCKQALMFERSQLDPVKLLHGIRNGQAALAAIATPESSNNPGRESLSLFLDQLPRLWQEGEVRPTHRKAPNNPRHWRTRKDPFETVWPEILLWLQDSPESTAKSLFDRLNSKYPGRFMDGQLRTLQRRIKEWRQIMARKLIFACSGRAS